MTLNKGDLVLVSDGESTTTCIILTSLYSVSSVDDYNFYYSYCIETGQYGMVYDSEIVSLVSKEFAPDFHFESELFDSNWNFFDYLCEHFTYFPVFPSGSFDIS